MIAVATAACGGGAVEPDASGPRSAAASDDGVEWFVDRAAPSGLDFVHFNGMSGDFYTLEVMGSGVALFDYDNDGDLFSSRRYSIRSSWWRFTQPANVRTRNRSAGGMV